MKAQDIFQKTKQSFDYIKDVGTLSLEKESLKIKRYSAYVELGKKFYKLQNERHIDVPELSEIIGKIDHLFDAIAALKGKIDNIRSENIS
jgi:hypothetical protein